MMAGSPTGGRLASGNQQLDAILGGGFPAHAINLVVGPPGSGKTILAQQYVFHNASPERPAVYLTTVSEPLEKVAVRPKKADIDVQLVALVFTPHWLDQSGALTAAWR